MSLEKIWAFFKLKKTTPPSPFLMKLTMIKRLNFFLQLLNINFVKLVEYEKIDEDIGEFEMGIIDEQIDEQINTLRYLLRVFGLTPNKEQLITILNDNEASKNLYETLITSLTNEILARLNRSYGSSQSASTPVEERQDYRKYLLDIINTTSSYLDVESRHKWTSYFPEGDLLSKESYRYSAPLDKFFTFIPGLYLRLSNQTRLNNRCKRLVEKLIKQDRLEAESHMSKFDTSESDLLRDVKGYLQNKKSHYIYDCETFLNSPHFETIVNYLAANKMIHKSKGDKFIIYDISLSHAFMVNELVLTQDESSVEEDE